MPKFRKKPVVITAEQFLGVDQPWPRGVHREAGVPPRCFVETMHAGQRVYLEPGDWVVPEPDGIHYYPIKPDVFANTYGPAEEPLTGEVVGTAFLAAGPLGIEARIQSLQGGMFFEVGKPILVSLVVGLARPALASDAGTPEGRPVRPHRSGCGHLDCGELQPIPGFAFPPPGIVDAIREFQARDTAAPLDESGAAPEVRCLRGVYGSWVMLAAAHHQQHEPIA